MPSSRRAHRRALVLSLAATAGVLVSTALAVAPTSSPNAAGSTLMTSPVAAVSTAAVGTLAASSADAEDALADGRDAVDAATATTAEVAASGMDLGDAAALDTTALTAAMGVLDELSIVPTVLFPERTENVITQTRAVVTRTADVRAALETARAEKAAADAAAAAAAEAQRQAEAAAAALAQANTPEGARATARSLAAERYGWGDDQFSCLSSLWEKESNWNYQAYNASSGATGIPQALPGDKMATAGADWQSNAATQIAWGLDYIDRAYGAPCAAWGHSQSTNWY